jgi:hypothetical protein
MNAMLDARIVAASIQRPRDSEHTAAAAFARTKPSSHGCRNEIAMVRIDRYHKSAPTMEQDRHKKNRRIDMRPCGFEFAVMSIF